MDRQQRFRVYLDHFGLVIVVAFIIIIIIIKIIIITNIDGLLVL